MYIQVVSSYAPSYGFGGTIPLFHDYACWARPHTTVQVLTADIHHDYGIFPREIELDDFPIKRFPVFFRWLTKKSLTLISPRLLLDLVSLIHKSNSDKIVIHLCETRGIVNIYCLVAKFVFKEKVVLIHSAFGMLQTRASKKRFIYDWLFTKRFFAELEAIFVQSDSEQKKAIEFLKHYGIDTSSSSSPETFLLPVHIYGGDDVPTPRLNGPVSQELCKKHGLNPRAFRVGFLGRLNEKKGLGCLYEYIKDFVLSSQFSAEIELIYVGRDDGYLNKLRAFQQKAFQIDGLSVKIIQDVYGDARFSWYKLFDCFVGLPSIAEETMVASVEALISGTPVILNANAHVPFAEYSGGSVSYVKSFEEFCGALLHISEGGVALRESSHEFANEFFHPESVKKRFLNALSRQL